MASRWAHLIRVLEPNHPYLNSFGKTIDEIVYETLRDAGIQVPPFKYPPALVEPLLGDISELLDRCIQYRSLASDLEIAAVQHALARELDVDLHIIDISLAEIVSLFEEYTEHGRRQLHVASKYNPEGLNPTEPLPRLLSGNMEEAKASAGSAGDMANRERDLLLKVKERLTRIKKSSDDFHERVNHPGSAHNWQERFDRTMVFFKEDLVEAYHKAKCVEIGLRVVYGTQDPQLRLPDYKTEKRFFDEFLLWTRRVHRYLESVSEQEIDIDLVLPIRNNYRLGQGGNPGLSLIESNVYIAEMQSAKDMAELSFVIPKEIFAGLDKVRLRGVGLSITYHYANVTPIQEQNRIFSMELVTPPLVMEDGALYYRPKLVFRNVRFYSPEMGVDYASSSAVHNLDPCSRYGWKLRVSRSIIQLLNQQCEIRFWNNPHNICLHLIVAAVPQQQGFRSSTEAQEQARADEKLREIEMAFGQAYRVEDGDHAEELPNEFVVKIPFINSAELAEGYTLDEREDLEEPEE